MKINRYFPFAFIYFFVNSLALPFGLTYTAILSPLLYWWVASARMKEILLPYFVCIIPFSIIHLLNIVDTKTYTISIINYTAVYIFCQAFYTFLKLCCNHEKIFRRILIINFLLCIVSIPVFFSPWHDILWMPYSEINGVATASRFKSFTYEASYYATLFTPLFFFYLLQIVLRQNKINSLLLLAMLLLPYLLSFSIGVIASALFAIIVTWIIHFRKLTKKKRLISLFLLTSFSAAFALIGLLLFYPKNDIFLRIANIISGNDTSGNGRTSEAFILSWKIMAQKSFAWGVGPGQIKILGGDIIRQFYLYPLDYDTIAIPNAAAETMAIFGWVGLLLRIVIELFLFFYTRVWTNYYRLAACSFLFSYTSSPEVLLPI